VRYRIAWRSLRTGYEGHGTFCFDSYASAQEQAAELNRKYQGIATQWVEAEDASAETAADAPEGEE
jgi:phosphoribosylaminoimidazole carboxylase (NCAIR synthetase)